MKNVFTDIIGLNIYVYAVFIWVQSLFYLPASIMLSISILS